MDGSIRCATVSRASPYVASIGQAQLAELVGLTRKTVSSLLGDLARAGIVDVRRTRFGGLRRSLEAPTR